MRYEWDSQKEANNIRDHEGVNFSMAVKALEHGEIISERYDKESSELAGEDRYVAVVLFESILLIVYTFRENGDVCHIISARRPDRKEMRNYDRYMRSRYFE